MNAPTPPRHDPSVAAAIREARNRAAQAQKVVDQASAARLSELKRQDPRAVARLPCTDELNSNDAEELRGWLATHMRPGRPAERKAGGRSKRWRKIWRRPWAKPVAMATLILGTAFAVAAHRTPSDYIVVDDEQSVEVMGANGSLETHLLKAGAKVLVERANLDGSYDIQYWVDGLGYRSVNARLAR